MPASSDREAVSRRPCNSPRLVREAWRQRRVLGGQKVVGAFVLVRTGLRERACWVWQETLRSIKSVDESDRSSTIFGSASLEALTSGVLLAPTAPTTFPPPPALV